ncbi:MAG: MgtC/SapB family protein [Balneolaceae bacterium]|nr:MgtC/SapB family protein [Balneolaceae bacterium]
MEIDPQWGSILKVVCSIFLGGMIGLERELASKPAGFRTHMLVAGAATLFVILGDFMIRQFATTSFVETIQTDPIRIMEAIITGISFLGAGTIIFKDYKNTVEGLTTAASILFVSGIGIAVAIDKIVMAAILTIVAIGILFVAGLAEDWIKKMRKATSYEEKDEEENQQQ